MGTSHRQSPDTTRLLVIACIAFFATGMAAASLGPAMPDLARRSDVTTAAASATLIAFPAGGLGGQIMAGVLGHFAGKKTVMSAGMILSVVGGLGLALSPELVLLLASTCCLGMGAGVMALEGNVLAAEASHGAGPLNLVNAMFGLGAIASPALIGLALTYTGSGLPALWSVPITVACALLLLAAVRAPGGADDPSAPQAQAAGRAGAAAWLSPSLVLIGGLIFLYVALEASIGGWLATILNRATAMPFAQAAAVTSGFWVAHTAARLAAALASGRLSPVAILVGCMVLSAAGAGLLLSCTALENIKLGLLAAAVLGVGVGPIMPSTIAIVRSSHPDAVGPATGIVMAVGSIGGMVVPWLVGRVILTHGASAGTSILLAAPLGMAFSLALIERRFRRIPSLR